MERGCGITEPNNKEIWGDLRAGTVEYLMRKRGRMRPIGAPKMHVRKNKKAGVRGKTKKSVKRRDKKRGKGAPNPSRENGPGKRKEVSNADGDIVEKREVKG